MEPPTLSFRHSVGSGSFEIGARFCMMCSPYRHCRADGKPQKRQAQSRTVESTLRLAMEAATLTLGAQGLRAVGRPLTVLARGLIFDCFSRRQPKMRAMPSVAPVAIRWPATAINGSAYAAQDRWQVHDQVRQRPSRNSFPTPGVRPAW
jgi:hypothetical protein